LIPQIFVDSTNIGLIGSSIGAGVAIGASSFPDVKTSVGLSGSYTAVDSVFSTQNLSSVYYFAATGDGNAAGDAQQLFDLTFPPRNIYILNSSALHGSKILSSSVALTDSAFVWLVDKLE